MHDQEPIRKYIHYRYWTKEAGGLSNNRKSIDCLLMTRGRCPNFRIAIKKLRAWENIWTQSQITFYM